MLTNSRAGAPQPTIDRWTLIRDVAVLQVKLVVDGLRDFLLVPVSIAAGIVSLLRSENGAGTEFYDLLRAGRRSERVINLFGAAERVHGPSANDAPLPDIDQFVSKVETFVVDEYNKGGITAHAKEQVDQILNSMRRATTHRDGSDDQGQT